jgi:hypothetical protein
VSALLEANRVVSFGLVVLIWLVQLVIYPAFASIAPERFARWHAGYTRTVTWIVAPLMLGQAVLLGWLVAVRPGALTIIASLCVAVAWAVTARWAVPLHERLQANGPVPTLRAGPRKGPTRRRPSAVSSKTIRHASPGLGWLGKGDGSRFSEHRPARTNGG